MQQVALSTYRLEGENGLVLRGNDGYRKEGTRMNWERLSQCIQLSSRHQKVLTENWLVIFLLISANK